MIQHGVLVTSRVYIRARAPPTPPPSAHRACNRAASTRIDDREVASARAKCSEYARRGRLLVLGPEVWTVLPW